MRKNKDISEWIITVGRHEGVILSDKRIAAQDLLEEIADRSICIDGDIGEAIEKMAIENPPYQSALL